MPYLPNKEIEKVLKKFDLGRLAEAFAKGDLNWHRDEWKEFIEAIRKDQKQKDLDGIIEMVGELKKERQEGMLPIPIYDHKTLEDLLAKLNNLR